MKNTECFFCRYKGKTVEGKKFTALRTRIRFGLFRLELPWDYHRITMNSWNSK